MGRPRSYNLIEMNDDEAFTKFFIVCKNVKFLIDEEDAEKCSGYKWHDKFSKPTNAYYAYAHNTGSKKLSLHRFLLNVVDKNVIVDHINGNTLDNRKENLRITNKLGNNRNVKKRKNCKSKYKGVTLRPSGRWGVYIKTEDKNICLGTFDLEVDAAKAYNIAAVKYFNEFARINVIEGEK